MAFTYTVNEQQNVGKTRIVTGKWTVTAGTSTGDIDTGLGRVLYASASTYRSAVVSAEPVFNETFPFINGPITLLCTSGTTGGWTAIGL